MKDYIDSYVIDIPKISFLVSIGVNTSFRLIHTEGTQSRRCFQMGHLEVNGRCARPQ